MPADTCPNCGTPRKRRARYCRECKVDFWKVAAGEPPSSRPGRRFGRGHLLASAILLAAALAAGGAVLIATRDEPGPSTLPASGEVWFGEAYDPNTFVIRGRTDTVRPNATFAMVAHATRAVEGASVLVRTLRNGTLVRTTGPDPRWNSGELLGFSLTAPLSQGTWRYEVTDLGGTLLAAGAVEVR